MASTECCRLCAATTVFFSEARGRTFIKCSSCHAVQVIAAQLPDPAREKALYLTHENDVEDLRYQAFVAPVTEAILAEQDVSKSGLDFGAGPGPVIAHQLSQKGYDIALYDPFFHNDINVLDKQYDFIISCEVIEHFHQPAKEFARLKRLLKPGGYLYCMTEFYAESVDFDRWYYKNDPTHVFFYHAQSVAWIAKQFGFNSLRITGRLAVFGN
jgi:SAM-dependent methyltransferase